MKCVSDRFFCSQVDIKVSKFNYYIMFGYIVYHICQNSVLIFCPLATIHWSIVYHNRILGLLLKTIVVTLIFIGFVSANAFYACFSTGMPTPSAATPLMFLQILIVIRGKFLRNSTCVRPSSCTIL